MLAVAACTGGGVFGASQSSSSGSVGASGSGPITGLPEPPSDATAEVPMPFVACSPTDAGGDAGDELADADVPPAPEDGGVDASPCDTPPPVDCASPTVMVVWSAGVCDGERCVFDATSVPCPGGCFRQMDGGDRCLE